MRIAHIIMAYKDPEQIERLVKNMAHPDFDFYVHIDTKFDIAPFAFLKSAFTIKKPGTDTCPLREAL